MTFSARSRLNRATLLVIKDNAGKAVRRPYLARIPTIQRVNFPDNQEYTLVEGDTWSNIAYRFLGDSYLWWVVCEWNRVVNPYDELIEGIAAGRTIQVPSVQRVNFEVLNYRRVRRMG